MQYFVTRNNSTCHRSLSSQNYIWFDYIYSPLYIIKTLTCINNSGDVCRHKTTFDHIHNPLYIKKTLTHINIVHRHSILVWYVKYMFCSIIMNYHEQFSVQGRKSCQPYYTDFNDFSIPNAWCASPLVQLLHVIRTNNTSHISQLAVMEYKLCPLNYLWMINNATA